MMRHGYSRVATSAGEIRIHAVHWGDPGNDKVVVCAHGLTRNARDFDRLAEVLAADYRVVCIDFPGRGNSDWLADSRHYTLDCYAELVRAWLCQLGASEVHWIGTSMGGLVAINLGADAQGLLRSMVINDVGPEVPAAAMQRIAAYVATEFRFATLRELEAHLRLVHETFGVLPDGDWRHLAEHGYRRTADDDYAFHYDPGIAEPFENDAAAGVDLWSAWQSLELPMLLLRGEESDVLTEAVAARMRHLQPTLESVEFADIGHAPSLMVADQISLVAGWLQTQT